MRSVWLAVGGVCLVVLYTAGFLLWQGSLGTPSLQVRMQDGARDVAPGTPLSLVISEGTEITGVELRRALLDERGLWRPAENVPVQLALQPLAEGAGVRVGQVLATDGSDLVVPDARYHLVLRALAREAAFPWPWAREVPIQREVQFTTRLSPRPQLPSRPVALRYGEAIELKWSVPMRSAEAVATPRAQVRVTLDPREPSVGRLALSGFEEGREYLVTIKDGLAANGVPLQRPYTLRVQTPVSPAPSLPAEPLMINAQQREVVIRWNTPLARIHGTVAPETAARWTIDPRDPRVTRLVFDAFAQGQTYTVTIDEAVAASGAPLRQPARFEVRTPPPLELLVAGPPDQAIGLPVNTAPTFTFSEPVANRAAAQAALLIEPATPGHFEWPDPATMVFVPDGGFPHEAEIRVLLRGGPGSVVGESGAYFEGEYRATFTTPPDKLIEVDLSEQKLYLWHAGELVRAFPVATGVRGAETPVGDFKVEYKMERARFRGRNPSGRSYDIPDVRWVLAFYGDYTIHGAYWRTAFGRPGSNGCVSLTDENARFVFEWAPEGTPIRIHD